MKRVVPSVLKRTRGFTLLELIVVVAIIALMAAMIWPSLTGTMNRSQLTNAAKQLRSELAKTRLKAIETGTPLQFRYLPGENRYEIGPAEFDIPQSFEIEEADPENRSKTNLQEEKQAILSDEGVVAKTLPVGILFREKLVFHDPFEEIGDNFSNDEESIPEKEPLSENESDEEEKEDEEKEIVPVWTQPLIFYPNGRTSNARIELVGRGHFRIELTIRGLTGAVVLGKIRRGE